MRRDELTAAENAFQQASAALDAARAAQAQTAANREAALGALKANAVLVKDTTVDTNPEVAAARARVEQAKVDLERTVIRAPVDGIVVQRAVHVGPTCSRSCSRAPVSWRPASLRWPDLQARARARGKVKSAQPNTCTRT